MIKVEHQERRLVELRNKISHNIAVPSDYSEYEDIIVKSGNYTHEEIMRELKSLGYDSWQDFYQKRNPILNNRQSATDGKAVGFVLGLSLAVLMLWALSGENNE